MTLSKIEAFNAAGEKLVLPLTQEDSGYIITEITGLDPVKADIATSTFANFDGVQFQSSSRTYRNIVITMGFEPDYETQTVQSMRAALYSWFSPELMVKLRFFIGAGLALDISGYVESFENPLFSKDPSVQISILCPRPDFQDATMVTYPGMTVEDMTEADLMYYGSVETGVLFTLLPDRPVYDFSINVRHPDNIVRTLAFADADGLEDGDVLAVSTIPGAKSVVRTRSAIETNLLGKVSSISSWVTLKPGLNKLRVQTAGLAVPYLLDYRNVYGGL